MGAVQHPPVVTENRDAGSVEVDLLRTCADGEMHTPLQEILLEDGGDFGVAVGKDLTTRYHEAHLRSEALEDVGELHARHPGPDDDHVLGDIDHVVTVPRREHSLSVHRRPLRDPWRRAC